MPLHCFCVFISLRKRAALAWPSPFMASYNLPPFLACCTWLIRNSALHSKSHCCFSYAYIFPIINNFQTIEGTTIHLYKQLH